MEALRAQAATVQCIFRRLLADHQQRAVRGGPVEDETEVLVTGFHL